MRATVFPPKPLGVVKPRGPMRLASRTGAPSSRSIQTRAAEKNQATRVDRLEKAKSTVIWDTLDLVSAAGTIGGATLVVLGYDLMFATLPIGLPLISLFIGIRRERQRAQARDVLDEMMLDDMADQRNALSNVEKQMTSVSEKIDQLVRVKMKTFEEKLNRIEATMVSTGQNVKQVSSGIKSLPGVMRKIAELQQQTVVYAVSTEFRSLFEKWGTTQLQSMSEVSNQIKFLQESIERLEAYDLKPKGPLSFGLPGATIDVEAESKKAAREGTSVLKKMRTLVQTEISSILSQLKDNQVEMMQSLRDVKLNPLPQADYAYLEEQLDRIEDALSGLPSRLADTFKAEAAGMNLKDIYTEQFSSISSVVNNLERAIEELKKSRSDGESSEFDALEEKWNELRLLMKSLSDQIVGVNERMEQIISNPEPALEFEVDESENERVKEPVGAEGETSSDYLEFSDTVASSSNQTGEWEVLGSYNEITYEGQPDSEETVLYSENGNKDRLTDETPQDGSSSGSKDGARKVGNAKTGLDLLKKGRLALEEDFGEAYRYLVDALDQFESILEVDPANVQCLGNCGNTLLALGELKLRMAKEMEEQQPKSEDSLSQLQQESQQFLTLAGRRFKTLLETRPDDKRAYMNWGKALCMRAQLTDDPSLKMQLYDAAIVKYEQILSFAPEFVDASFFCGVALKESSDVPLGSPMERRNRLNQAIVYFENVSRMAPSSPYQFEAFQMIQECQQMAGSPTLI